MADHVVQVARCMATAGAGTDEQTIAMFQDAKAIYDRHHGEGHVSTAGCLAGIAERYGAQKDHQKCLEYAQEALAVAEKAGKGASIEAAEALMQIGEAHFFLKQYDESLKHRERRLQVLLDHHGEEGAKHVATVASAYRGVGDVYSEGLDDWERALENYTKGVAVAEEATGKLSDTTGLLCESVGIGYYRRRRYAEAVPWFERAVEAYTFTFGAENEQYTKRAKKELEDSRRKAAGQQQ